MRGYSGLTKKIAETKVLQAVIATRLLIAHFPSLRKS